MGCSPTKDTRPQAPTDPSSPPQPLTHALRPSQRAKLSKQLKHEQQRTNDVAASVANLRPRLQQQQKATQARTQLVVCTHPRDSKSAHTLRASWETTHSNSRTLSAHKYLPHRPLNVWCPGRPARVRATLPGSNGTRPSSQQCNGRGEGNPAVFGTVSGQGRCR